MTGRLCTPITGQTTGRLAKTLGETPTATGCLRFGSRGGVVERGDSGTGGEGKRDILLASKLGDPYCRRRKFRARRRPAGSGW